MTSTMETATAESRILLTDEQLVDFVINGYTIVETDLGDEFNRNIFDQLEALPDNPGDAILGCRSVPRHDIAEMNHEVANAFSILSFDHTRKLFLFPGRIRTAADGSEAYHGRFLGNQEASREDRR